MKSNKSSAKLRRTGNLAEQWPMLVMMAPFLIMFCLFAVFPIFASVGLSFTRYDMLSTPTLVGIENYRRMFLSDEVFSIVLKNTFVFAIVASPLGFLLSFVLAWFVNDFSPRIRTLLSFMFYAPSLVGNALMVWQIAFSGDSYGYANSLLLSIGVITEPITWLKDANYVMPIIIIVYLWQSMGISFLANISGLQNVSRDLYEAGAIDGIRSRWQELRYITLPAMYPMLMFSAVMQIQSGFSAGAISVSLAGYPSVQYAADMLVTYMSDVGSVRYEMGYACAIAVILFIIMASFRIIVGKILNLVKH